MRSQKRFGFILQVQREKFRVAMVPMVSASSLIGVCSSICAIIGAVKVEGNFWLAQATVFPREKGKM